MPSSKGEGDGGPEGEMRGVGTVSAARRHDCKRAARAASQSGSGGRPGSGKVGRAQALQGPCGWRECWGVGPHGLLRGVRGPCVREARVDGSRLGGRFAGGGIGMNGGRVTGAAGQLRGRAGGEACADECNRAQGPREESTGLEKEEWGLGRRWYWLRASWCAKSV